MTRAEHLQWYKDRALEYCDRGDANNAWASMLSDMQKHDETKNHLALKLGLELKLSGHLDSAEEVRKFILGFN